MISDRDRLELSVVPMTLRPGRNGYINPMPAFIADFNAARAAERAAAPRGSHRTPLPTRRGRRIANYDPEGFGLLTRRQVRRIATKAAHMARKLVGR